MTYKVIVIERESGKIEAVVGNDMTDSESEKLFEQTKTLVDLSQYQVKVLASHLLPAFNA